MSTPDIEIVPTEMREVRQMLGGLSRFAGQALGQAQKRTSKNIRTRVAKTVRKDYFVKSSRIKKGVYYTRSKRPDGLFVIEWSGWRLLLGEFYAKSLKRGGVSYAIKRGQGRKRIENAYISKGGKNPRRLTRGGKRKSYALKGPSLPEMVNDHMGDHERFALERMEFNLKEAVNSIFRREKWL